MSNTVQKQAQDWVKDLCKALVLGERALGDVMIKLGGQLDNTGEEGTSQLANCLHEVGLWACLWGIFLVAN